MDDRFMPQELFRNGIDMPPQVAKSVIAAHVQDVRFMCHNWCSQHFLWVVMWILLSPILWFGIVFLSSSSYGIGIGFIMVYVGLLLLHVFGCVMCRRWRRPAVFGKLAQLNGRTAQYHCLTTVVNSRYGTSFHLVFYFYNIEACVIELAAKLHQRMAYYPVSSDDSRTEVQRAQDESCMQARSLILMHSPEYLLKFMEGTLEEVTSQKHTIQGCCLCQYVERNLATLQVQPHVFPPVAQPQIPGFQNPAFQNIV